MYSTAAQADNFNLLSAFNLLQSEEQYAESEKKDNLSFDGWASMTHLTPNEKGHEVKVCLFVCFLTGA